MKKLLTILVMFMLSGFTYANEIQVIVDKKDMNKVNTIGYRILNSNRIPYKITFGVKNSKVINASTYYSDNSIILTNTLVKIMDDDDELASVIAHEISHGVDYRQGILKGYFSFLGNVFNSKKYEYKADKRAIDYLVKAGYNPISMIIALNKTAPQTRFDWCVSHPLTTRRMMEVYEYIYVKYPQYLVQNEYKDNMYYQNFLLTSRENRQKLENKIKANSKRKVKYL